MYLNGRAVYHGGKKWWECEKNPIKTVSTLNCEIRFLAYCSSFILEVMPPKWMSQRCVLKLPLKWMRQKCVLKLFCTEDFGTWNLNYNSSFLNKRGLGCETILCETKTIFSPIVDCTENHLLPRGHRSGYCMLFMLMAISLWKRVWRKAVCLTSGFAQ